MVQLDVIQFLFLFFIFINLSNTFIHSNITSLSVLLPRSHTTVSILPHVYRSLVRMRGCQNFSPLIIESKEADVMLCLPCHCQLTENLSNH